MVAVIKKLTKKIRCSNCGKEVIPETLNPQMNLKICPNCNTKLSG